VTMRPDEMNNNYKIPVT